MKTLYDLLQVPRQATFIEIEQSYRHHLSRYISKNGGRPMRQKDQLRLQTMREAYLMLSSPVRRQAYDRNLVLSEQRRGKTRITGGTICAACLLLIGLLLIGGSVYYNA